MLPVHTQIKRTHSSNMLNFLLAFLSMLGAVLCKESDIKTVLGVKQNDIGCKHRSTLGRDYIGRANTTKTGIPCQKWSDTEPHEHQFTDVGDHNHCRNPEGTYSNVWCFNVLSNNSRKRNFPTLVVLPV